MKIVTSNTNKLREFQRFGLNYEMAPGLDLLEVKGTMDEVIVYKALDAGAGLIVEDTILEIDGQEVVDIRWKIDELKTLNQPEGIPARWIVSLGYNDGDTIQVYRGIVEGFLINPVEIPEDAFGFDPYFVPAGQQFTLAELELEGSKDDYSARKLAVVNMINQNATLEVPVIDLKPWTGDYQH